jgi:hypothetical protein
MRQDPAVLHALTNLAGMLMAMGRMEVATACFAEAWRRDTTEAGARREAGQADEESVFFKEAL